MARLTDPASVLTGFSAFVRQDVHRRYGQSSHADPESLDDSNAFERFWRSDAARAMPGSGLGLAIVADAVQGHAGDVHLETAPNGVWATRDSKSPDDENGAAVSRSASDVPTSPRNWTRRVGDHMAYQMPLTIKDTLEHISHNRYVLPAIQRELVWAQEPARMARLFDSILRGYPIGTFLFWKVTPEQSKEFHFYEFMR